MVGPSGCGKSTLLSCIAGLERADRGEIRIDGELVFSQKKKIFVLPEERQVGMVFQNYALWPHKTVYNNIAYPLKIRKFEKRQIEEKVKELLDTVGLCDKGSCYPYELSGGEQQRVALARALIMKPKVLILDEPLSSLDFKLREKMQYEIKRLQRETGITIIHVTHDQNEAMGIADRIAVMKDGLFIQTGTPKEVYESPKTEFVANFVGKANIVMGRVENYRNKKRITFLGKNRIEASNNEIEEGQRKLICIRPENINLSKESGDMRGIITGVNYRGNIVNYHITIEEIELIAETNPNELYKLGDEVWCEFNRINIL
ncbi:ABC transporter ATP-binding protein [Wukongibacter sp. M2B1]|uniref:ABC transporter ATP-binding protein n=1 Tax=Wukongibacter sp. M2B1 TaxID=3088895 RepID=UPI003D78DA21